MRYYTLVPHSHVIALMLLVEIILPFNINCILVQFYAVPESAPINLITKKRSSTSINVTWGELSNTSLWNGIGIGYEVQYRLKNANSGNWISVLISGTSNRQYIATGLLKYEFYEFKVAGITSKGSGVFSDIKEDRTMEDGMSLNY